jgi:hypothetical protein
MMMAGTYLWTCRINFNSVDVHVSVYGLVYFLTKFHTRFTVTGET